MPAMDARKMLGGHCPLYAVCHAKMTIKVLDAIDYALAVIEQRFWSLVRQTPDPR
jgi:hypothetical protein